ncbi:MAG: ribonuclease D [Alphaproteobacteria bacterium]|nr:ribonuclease D [Alphaproteobacteria bacterium]
MDIKLHRGDLPDRLDLGPIVAVDCETMGLRPLRDRLCLVQLSGGNGVCHLVQFEPDAFDAPNLKRLFTDSRVLKIFHFARFDLAVIRQQLGVVCEPVYCTKVASKLCRTYTDRHGLKDLCKDLLGIDLSKQQQTSDWGAGELKPEQLAYAATDVLHLHDLKDRLDDMLLREGRRDIAEACFKFLPWRSELDLLGWDEPDALAH